MRKICISLCEFLNRRCQDGGRKVEKESRLGPWWTGQDCTGERGDPVTVWESPSPEGQGGQWQGPGTEGLWQYQEGENGGMQRTQGSQVCFTGPIILQRDTPANAQIV